MENQNSTLKKENLKIVEGKNYEPALCGRREVMRTQLPLSSWGFSERNVPSKYCPKCNEQYHTMK